MNPVITFCKQTTPLPQRNLNKQLICMLFSVSSDFKSLTCIWVRLRSTESMIYDLPKKSSCQSFLRFQGLGAIPSQRRRNFFPWVTVMAGKRKWALGKGSPSGTCACHRSGTPACWPVISLVEVWLADQTTKACIFEGLLSCRIYKKPF